MVFRPPNLDDRDFDQLVEQARHRIAQSCPGWTDLSAGDPGMVLIEVFAHLTETMIYRLNRVPEEKAYVEFLRLIGVRLQPPSAAEVNLQFKLSRPQNQSIEIPEGTRVTTSRSDGHEKPPVFVTTEAAVITAGSSAIEVPAIHCDLVVAEFLGEGTGLPGLSFEVRRPPIIAPSGDELDLVVGVEALPEEIDASMTACQHNGKTFRIWREVENFSNLGANRCVYIADHLEGRITFAPAVRMKVEDNSEELHEMPRALAEAPALDREIRVWYRCGGGGQGNVSTGVLTVLKDPIPGIEVTNLAAATGGCSAETLGNAFIRGPQELHSLERAVTARDFELVAMRSSGAVNRAKAFTRAKLWAHAQPGTVGVLLVPEVPEVQKGNGFLPPGNLQEQQTEAVLSQVQQELDNRRPLGTQCLVNWARYKTVRVKAQVFVRREEDPTEVKKRILTRLYQTINPLSLSNTDLGWEFGKSLTSWDVYKLLGAEAGVSSVRQVRLIVDDVPESKVKALEADGFQADTMYAASGDMVFRSMNNGRGWESVGSFPGEEIVLVKAYPREAATQLSRAGFLAVATKLSGGKGSGLYLSHDCGETWEPGPKTKFRIEDMAWMDRDGAPSLFFATNLGLYELTARAGAGPVQIVVDSGDLALGFYAVAVSTDTWGKTSVAVAARGDRGVFLSSEGGKPNSFSHIGLDGKLVRILEVQHRGPHRYLWAGVAAVGDDPGEGVFRWTLTGSIDSPEGWRSFDKDWNAGGCRALAFQGSIILAASLRRGVLRLDVDARNANWISPEVDCGLPLRDVGRLQPVNTMASSPDEQVLLTGGFEGVFCSKDHGVTFEQSSSREFTEEVTLPQAWLFCSGEHEITVESEDAKK
jgi:Baseplate J-like protein